MSWWDLMTWLTVAVLGPGSVIVFAAFLRDVRQWFRARGSGASDRDETGSRHHIP